ncbi:MAG: lysylphosphatidylglycerol synthase transmembrane domain-containing protein, partial [Vicinamibacterales bacterium]
LPIRLGELARAYIVSRSEAIPAARVFTTIAVEKLADLMLVGVTAGLLIMFATLPDWLEGPGAALVATGLLAAAAAAFGLRPGTIPWAGRVATRLAPTSWRPRIERQFALAGEGLAALQNRATSVEFWLLTTAIVLLAASTNYLMFFAFDLRLSPVTAMVLLLSLQVGTTVAPAPGNLGVFHYVVVLVLTAYGVDRTTALAYALALYAVAILPKVGVGGILLAFQYRWILGPAGVKA